REDGYSRTSSYRVRGVEHPDVEKGSIEGEPNDAEARAQTLALDARIHGYLHRAGDRDRFEVEVGANGGEGRQSDAGARREDETRRDGGSGGESGEASGGDAGARIGLPPSTLSTSDYGGAAAPDDPEAGARKEAPEHVVRVTVRPTRKRDRLALTWTNPRSGGQPERFVSEAPGEAAVLCNVPVDRGSLALSVEGVDRSAQQIKPGFDYALTVDDVAAEAESGALEIEPNDGRDQADGVRLGDERRGYISSTADDADTYAFAVPRRGGAGSPAPS
ncbi:MAG: hypothetical protein ABEL76_13780, partial [Bradymonadaceae bacterium]